MTAGTIVGSADDNFPLIDCEVNVSDSSDTSGTRKNLVWHTVLQVDHHAGSREMQQLMKVTTQDALQRLRCDWSSSQDFGAEDVYTIQLPHCYDVVSRRKLPFETWFAPADWTDFEFLRDTKYHYSEGYGSDTWKIAVPWLVVVVRSLKSGSDHPSTFPSCGHE